MAKNIEDLIDEPNESNINSNVDTIDNKVPIKINKDMPIVIDVQFDDNERLFAYARETFDKMKTEIGGLIIGEIKEGRIRIDEFVLISQEAGPAHFTIRSRQLMEFMRDEPEKAKRILGWWHSHCDFGTFWSTQDMEATNLLLESETNRCLAIVVDIRRNYMADLFCRSPDFKISYRMGCIIDPIPPNYYEITKSVRDEIKVKVKEVSGYGNTNFKNDGRPKYFY